MNILQKPHIVKSMFVNRELNRVGAYAIQLTKNGCVRRVVVDDQFPKIDQDLAFCTEKNGHLWVPLLNKAWAKLHRSYDSSRINGIHHAMRDLTSAPSMEWNIDQKPDIFNNIMEGIKKNYLMLVTIDIKKPEEREPLK